MIGFSRRERWMVLGLMLLSVAAFSLSRRVPRDDGEKYSEISTDSWGRAPRVELHLLDLPTAAFAPGGRDLFAFVEVAEDSPLVVPIDSTRNKGDRSSPQLEPPVVSLEPSQHTVQPPFRLLGWLGPKDDRIGVFERSSSIDLVRVGETIAPDYSLVGFTHGGVRIVRGGDKAGEQKLALPGR